MTVPPSSMSLAQPNFAFPEDLNQQGSNMKAGSSTLTPLSVESVASDRQNKSFVFLFFVNAPARVLAR